MSVKKLTDKGGKLFLAANMMKGGRIKMKPKISKQLQDPNYLTDIVKLATISLLIMILMVIVANLLSAIKQTVLS